MATPYKTLCNLGNIENFKLQLLRQNYDWKVKNWQVDYIYPFLESKKGYLLFKGDFVVT